MDSALDDRQMAAIGVHRCPNCRMLFPTPHQLERHMEKFCAFNPPRADSKSLSVGRSGRPMSFKGAPPFGLPPSLNDVERESSRLLRELEDYRKRSQEQRKAEEEMQRKMAGGFLDRRAMVHSAGNLPIREGDMIGTDSFRRKVKAIGGSSREVLDISFRRAPSADVKYVIRRTGRPPPPPPPPPIQMHMAMKIEQLRAQLADLEFNGGLDRLTDFLLNVNEVRHEFLRGGGADPEMLKQLTDLQMEAQAARRALAHATMRAISERETEAALVGLQHENARLQAQLAAARTPLPLPLPMPVALPVPQAYYPPADNFAHRLQHLLQPNLRVLPLQNQLEEQLRAELSVLRAEVQALREAPRPLPLPPPALSQPEPTPLPAPAPREVLVEETEEPKPVGMYVTETLGRRNVVDRVVNGEGIVLFYDFVSGLESRISVARLVVSTFTGDKQMGDPYMMPSVDCTAGALGRRVALLNTRQPLQLLVPRPDAFVLVELQVGEQGATELDTYGWLRIRVFDLTKLLIDGRFRTPFRVPPIRPIEPDDVLETIPTCATSELFYRIVRDADVDEETLTPAEDALPAFIDSYYAPPTWERVLEEFAIANRTLGPQFPVENRLLNRALGGLPDRQLRALQIYVEERNRRFRLAERLPDADHIGARLELPPAPNTADKMKRLGFRICFVKHAEPGLAKVRLSVHEAKSGRIAKAALLPISASSSATHQTFKTGYHMFGQQEALFDEVDLRFDDVLIVRFYLKRESPRSAAKRTYQPDDLFIHDPTADAEATAEFDEGDLVAWSCMPLLAPRTSGALVFPDRKHYSRTGEEFNLAQLVVLSGLRTLPLYKPPVCEPWQVPHAQFFERPLRYPRYGNAKMRIRIMAEDYFLPDNMSSSTKLSQKLDDYDVVREAMWIPLQRNEPPKKPHFASDGFDLYIDGCRFLPEGVTITKVYGALFNRRWQRFGPPLSATQLLDSDVFCPQYDVRQEVRDPALPPSLTLLLTFITIERFSKLPVILGYASLNVFCEIGTERQPETDQNIIQVALNEGCHQLRIYPNGPNRGAVFSNAWSKEERLRPFPAATALVRLVRAAIGPTGKTLETSKVPRGDWMRLGLIQPKPLYRDNVYYSFACEPWLGERAILFAQDKRAPLAAAESCRTLSDRTLPSVEAVRDFVSYSLLPQMEVDIGKLPEWNTSFVAPYRTEFGFKVMLDTVFNIPWQRFTLGYMCLNPPGAFYMGPPYQNYDPVTFFTQLDWQNSTNSTAIFLDTFKHFRFRSYTKYLTAIIQFHEIAFTKSSETLQVQLLQMAWCAVPIFIDSFVRTETVVVPLFSGVPTVAQLLLLAQLPLDRFIQEMRQNNSIKFQGKAYAVVRVADGRRMEEMVATKDYNILRLNTTFIPPDLRANYTQNTTGTRIADMAPTYMTQAEFEKNLIERFKEMVYLSYEAAPRVAVLKSSQDGDNAATSTK